MAEDLRRSDHLYSVNCGPESKPPSIALQILTGKTSSYILQNEHLQMSRTPPPAHSGLSPSGSRLGRSPSPARPNSRGSVPSRPPSLVHQELLQPQPGGLPINLSRPNSRGQRLTPSPNQSQPPGIPILQGAGLICHPPRSSGESGVQLLQVPIQGLLADTISPASSIAEVLSSQGLGSVMNVPGHIIPTTSVSMPALRITPSPSQVNNITVPQHQTQSQPLQPLPPRIEVHLTEPSPPPREPPEPLKHTSLALAQLLKLRNPTLVDHGRTVTEHQARQARTENVVIEQKITLPVVKPRISFEAVGLVQKSEVDSVVGRPAPMMQLSPNGPPPQLVPMVPRVSEDLPKLACDSAVELQEKKDMGVSHLSADSFQHMPQLVRQAQITELDRKPAMALEVTLPKTEMKVEQVLTDKERDHLKREEEEEDLDGEEQKVLVQPFNMRVMNLTNFPSAQTGYRATYRSHSVAIHRAKAGSICNTAKSLDLLRQNLQKHINKELDGVIQKYIDGYFKMGMDNIRQNNGDASVAQEHVWTVCRQMLEEAKKMYAREAGSTTPDVSDNVSDSGSLVENKTVRHQKLNLFPGSRKRRGSADSDASVSRKKKKGRPPLHAQGLSGRSTPNKNKGDPVRREGEKWDPQRLKAETQFVMGARANKALGLGATRGRLYIKHPDVFKYCGDQDDKTWLFESHHMPATGGKAYMLLVDDIKELAETDEYKDCPGLMLDEIVSFTVPEWMLSKMRAQMQALRTDVSHPPKVKGRGIMPNFPLAMDVEERLPFSFPTDNSKEQLSDSKSDTQPSPSNMENMDLLSTSCQEDDETPVVSPYTMTGGFECDISPAAMSPAPSDLDHLEEDATLSTPFQLQGPE